MTDTLPTRLDGAPLHVAIVGSREYPALNRVIDYVRGLPAGTVVVSGGARGVDITAETEARACGLPEPIIHKPDWKRYGVRKAPHERNKLIARDCDVMVAFWYGSSAGTQDALNCAKRIGKPTDTRTPGGAA